MRLDALAAREREQAALPQHSAYHCTKCGDAIAEERRLAIRGCQLCVSCKTIAEQHDRLFRK